jgi:hypothetical protein
MEAEASMALHRLQTHQQTAETKVEAGLLPIRKIVNDPLLEMRVDYMIPEYHYSKDFNVIIDRNYWKNEEPMFPEGTLIWFTEGSRANSGTGSGMYGQRPRRSLNFPLGKLATVFQTEIYAIL